MVALALVVTFTSFVYLAWKTSLLKEEARVKVATIENELGYKVREARTREQLLILLAQYNAAFPEKPMRVCSNCVAWSVLEEGGGRCEATGMTTKLADSCERHNSEGMLQGARLSFGEMKFDANLHPVKGTNPWINKN